MAISVTPILVPSPAPEDVATLEDGRLVTGTEDGWLWLIDPESGRTKKLALLGGRPLGIESYGPDELVVCDGEAGKLLAVRVKDGVTRTLVERVAGQPLRCVNNAAVAQDGRVFFTSSSKHHPVSEWRVDMLRDEPSGRLLCYHPDGRVEVLAEELAFANGVALLPDESAVIVAQSGRDELLRVSLHNGRIASFAALDGIADNLSTGTDGLIWAAIPSPLDRRLTAIRKLPRWGRRLVANTVGRIPVPIPPYARVMAFNSQGQRIHDLSFDPKQYRTITGVREYQGNLYLGSLHGKALGVVEPLAGVSKPAT